MKISIIGAGVLGKVYGGIFSLAGHEVHYLMRSDYLPIKTAGSFTFQMEELKKEFTINIPLVHSDPNELPPSDLIIISLKTTENEQVQCLLSQCLTENSIILIIQNGILNEERISQYTGTHPLICGISSMAASKIDPITVGVAFQGHLRLAPYVLNDLDYCKIIADALKNSPISVPIEINPHYKTIRWQKLAWNIPFGMLSIIFNKATENLASEEPYLTISLSVIQEVMTLAKSEGVSFTEDFISSMLNVTKQVNNYFPSIYRDFHAGKKIEKEYLIDNVIQIAKQNKVTLPFLTLLEKQLSTLIEMRDLGGTPHPPFGHPLPSTVEGGA